MVLLGRALQRRLKRVMDVVGALAMLILFGPLMLFIAAAMLVRNGPPLMHRETRIGLGGEPFTLVKFRTLRVGTGSAQSVAAEGDWRIEPLGQFLRRWRLDEFPQLGSVLRGQMSLVGPRPLPEAHAAAVPGKLLEELGTFAPGLTSRAAVLFLAEDAVLAGRSDAEQLYLDTILPAKLDTELAYVRNWSLAADLSTLWQTVVRVWSRRAREQSYRRVSRLLQS
jgi:lipopolysaccharide/colanic/teichoic acid biosynthesis glycosyltransferase